MFEEHDTFDGLLGNVDTLVPLPESLFPKGHSFVTTISGNGFYSIGLRDGDQIVYKTQNTAKPGQIVLVKYNDKIGLRRYYPENGHIRLALDNYPDRDIVVDTCEIIAVAAYAITDLEDKYPNGDCAVYRGTIN